jgi:hypothetical protein
MDWVGRTLNKLFFLEKNIFPSLPTYCHSPKAEWEIVKPKFRDSSSSDQFISKVM